MAHEPERWLGMGRRGWIALQWTVGILNAVSLLIDLDQGLYAGAAFSALCIAVVAGWSLPDDPPGKRAWVRDVVFYFLRMRQEIKLDEVLRRQANLIISMGEVMEKTAIELVGPELGHHANPHYDWRALPDSAREVLANAAALSAAAAPLCVWWAMVEAQEELAGERVPDHAVVLHFMGSGASTAVTAGELRALVAAALVVHPATGRPLPAAPHAPQEDPT